MLRLLSVSRVPSQFVALSTAKCMYSRGEQNAQRPRFEFMSVEDDAAKGYMLRAMLDEKRVVITHFPQLGPRKSDPNDPAPQFDFGARRSLRLFQHEVAGLLTVCEGKAAKHQISSVVHDLTFAPIDNSGYELKGVLSKKSNPVEWGIRFEGYKATMLRHFLSSALDESFGFQKHFKAHEERYRANSARSGKNKTQQAK